MKRNFVNQRKKRKSEGIGDSMRWGERVLFISAVLVIAIVSINRFVYVKAETKSENLQISRRVIASLDEISEGDFDYSCGFGNSIQNNSYFTFQNMDGSYALCTNTVNSSFQIFEPATNKKIRLQHAGKVSGFTKDEKGQYYILFAGEFGFTKITNDDYKWIITEGGNKIIYELCKYDASGKLIAVRKLDAFKSGSLGGFDGGDISILAKNGKVQVVFARSINPKFFVGKSKYQGNFYWELEGDKMYEKSFGDHLGISFNNLIVYDEQKQQFVFVESQLSAEQDNGYLIETEDDAKLIFPFKEGKFDNGNVYSQLGGLLFFQDKYVLVGTYENKTMSTDISPRNLFYQFISKDLSTISEPVYLTDYKNQTAPITEVGNPKVVKLDESTFIIVASEYTNKDNVRRSSAISPGDPTIPNKTMLYKINLNGQLLEKKEISYKYIGKSQLSRYGMIYYDTKNQSIDYFTSFRNKIYLNQIKPVLN